MKKLFRTGRPVLGMLMFLCVLGVGIVDRSHAAIITYFDRTAWETAVGPPTITEDLEGFVSDEFFDVGFPPVALNGMILSSSGFPFDFDRVDVLPLFGTGINTPNGSAFVLASVNLDLDFLDPDFTKIVELTFNAPVSAFGADFNGIDGAVQGVIDVFDTFSTLLATIDAPSDQTFIGFQATGGELVKFLRFRGSIDTAGVEAFGFDNIAAVSAAELDPIPTAVLEDPTQPAGSDFGAATALSEDGLLVAMGAPFAQSSPDAGGIVQIYRRVLDVWTLEAELTAGADVEADAAFGAALAFSPNPHRLAVGAPLEDCTVVAVDIDDCGAVYVFEEEETPPGSPRSWVLEQKLDHQDTPDDPTAPTATFTGDEFGASVAMTFDTLVVGAPGRDRGLDDDVGDTYVFHRSSPWTLEPPLPPPPLIFLPD